MSDQWWIRLPGETEQEWVNRIEDHNPSEAGEIVLSHLRWRDARRADREATS